MATDMIASCKDEAQMVFIKTAACNEGRKRRGSDWLNLPENLLTIILSKLVDIFDYIRFGVVCHSWKKLCAENLHLYFPPPQPPMLMFNREPGDQTRCLFSVTQKRVLKFQLPISPDNSCIGSTHGWLVIIDKKSPAIRLYNPFLMFNNEIELPSLFSSGNNSDSDPEDTICSSNCKYYHLCTTLLSGNPISNPNTIVFAIYGAYCRLGFCKPGDHIWASLGSFFYNYFDDVVYYKDQLYVVDKNGEVFTCDVTDPHPELMVVAEAPPYPFKAERTYLVESSGELLQVRKYLKNSREVQFTVKFEVFKLIQGTWIQVKSLNGQTLFLGDNSSLSIGASDFPGCMPDCIYFTDDTHDREEEFAKENNYDMSSSEGFYDIGRYNIEDGKLDRHYPIKAEAKSPPPIWIEPTLRRN